MRRRLLTVVVVLVLLLLGGALVLDRVGKSYAERELSDRIAAEVASQNATSGIPDVTIDGFPFLTQVAAGDYQQVNIALPDFAAPDGTGGTVKMSLLDISAQDVRAPLSTLRNGGDVIAGVVSGAGTIGYAEITALVNQDGLKLAEKDGKLNATVQLDIPGQKPIEITGTTNLTVENGSIRVRFSEVTSKDLPALPFLQNMINALAYDLKIPELPLNLVVQQVEALPEGLRVTAGAENVNLSAGGL
ncbi:LmeA family phospholipid-binding protein [Actinoplanes sp. CA-015351]|uniref:LmeA family phospholipid-binding protein n=1 Tax=Actinoplanes sp. CA-015351 TaxID=3239897 RepID=UPI003D9861DF